jgi:hypothetical protein
MFSEDQRKSAVPSFAFFHEKASQEDPTWRIHRSMFEAFVVLPFALSMGPLCGPGAWWGPSWGCYLGGALALGARRKSQSPGRDLPRNG